MYYKERLVNARILDKYLDILSSATSQLACSRQLPRYINKSA